MTRGFCAVADRSSAKPRDAVDKRSAMISLRRLPLGLIRHFPWRQIISAIRVQLLDSILFRACNMRSIPSTRAVVRTQEKVSSGRCGAGRRRSSLRVPCPVRASDRCSALPLGPALRLLLWSTNRSSSNRPDSGAERRTIRSRSKARISILLFIAQCCDKMCAESKSPWSARRCTLLLK